MYSSDIIIIKNIKKNVIFICNGNIERSVVAAECLRNILKEKKLSSKFLVDSYGLQGTQGASLPKHKTLSEYPKEWKVAKPILEKLKIDISGHSFQKITPSVVKKASLIIAMDKKVYLDSKNSLLNQFPEAKYKIHLFSELAKNNRDIKDPNDSGNVLVHKAVINNIYSTINKNYKTILKWTHYDK